jgi:hypothetical protein
VAVAVDPDRWRQPAARLCGGGGWNQESLTFTDTGETTGALTFTGLDGWASGDSTTFIDNLSLSAVPEPTSTLMLALGVLGLVAWRRRAPSLFHRGHSTHMRSGCFMRPA